MSILRAALTQTINAYQAMPDLIEDLPKLEPQLDQIRQANIEHHLELIDQAAQAGVKLLCLGELFAGPYFALSQLPMWKNLSENAREGPVACAMTDAALRHKMVIVAPIYELCKMTGNRYNAAIVIDADGSILGTYRKNHIPQGTNEQASFDEAFYYQAGDPPENTGSKILGNNPHFPVFDTQAGRLGVAICYDRHFPGVMASLAKAGAELVVCPAVTFGENSRAMWEMEFCVDAARHNIFIAGSNRLGAEKPWNQPYFGVSYFTGPSLRCKPVTHHPNLVIADLDLSTLNKPDPSGWDLARDARPDIYG